MTTRAALGEQMSMRLAQEDVERLRALEEQVPDMSRNALARAALRLGLAALEDDLTRLFRPARPVSRKGRVKP